MSTPTAFPSAAHKSASVDLSEVTKFAALAAEWWAPDGAFAALHRMNPARLAFLRERLARHFSLPGAGRRPLAGLSILDVGCGGGLVSLPLARMGANVLGLDAGADAIGAAQAHAQAAGVEGVRFRNAAAETLAAEGATFDAVVALEVLEHVAEPVPFLQTLAQLVRPGGIVALSTINRTPQARALAIGVAERILRWAPEGAHDFEKLIKPEEITAAIPSFAWDAPIGLSFNLADRAWRLSGDVSMNYLIAGAKP